MKFSVVIPCYCSYKTLSDVVESIFETMGSRNYFQSDFEIILVNDNSRDNTIGLIYELCDKYENIVGIDLAKNFGQASALMAGFRASKGEYIIIPLRLPSVAMMSGGVLDVEPFLISRNTLGNGKTANSKSQMSNVKWW